MMTMAIFVGVAMVVFGLQRYMLGYVCPHCGKAFGAERTERARLLGIWGKKAREAGRYGFEQKERKYLEMIREKGGAERVELERYKGND